jgi:hypothetical protein
MFIGEDGEIINTSYYVWKLVETQIGGKAKLAMFVMSYMVYNCFLILKARS